MFSSFWTVPVAYLLPGAVMIGDRSGIFVLTPMKRINLKLRMMERNGDESGIIVLIAMKILSLLILRLLIMVIFLDYWITILSMEKEENIVAERTT